MGRNVKKNSIANIAREVGVSAFAVSSVINNRPGVSDATRKKIQEVLNKVGYSRSYKLSSGRTIGLLLHAIWDDWFISALVRGVLAYSAENDCNIATIIHHPKSGKSLLEALRDHSCDAAIIAMSDEIIPEIENLANKTNIPLIIMNRSLQGLKLEGDVSNQIGYVNNNSYKGSFDMCKYLISLKHRRIAFVFRKMKQTVENHEDRIRGWKDAMCESGMSLSELDELLFKNNDIESILFKEKNISAIMCIDDGIAITCLRHCYEKHIRVPDELTVTGFGNMILCSELSPPLTSVDQKTKEVGYMAAKYAFELVSGKRTKAPNVILPVELVIRKSSSNYS